MSRSNLKANLQHTLFQYGYTEQKDHKSELLNSHIKSSKKIGIKYLEEKVTDFGYQSKIGNDRYLIDCKPSPVEVFTSMLALDLHMRCCRNYSFVAKLIKFVTKWHEKGIFSFFQEHKLLPADVDCTSVGLSILLETNGIDHKIVDVVIDKILKNINNDGVIQVYFDSDRPRVDPIVCINALYLIHLANKHEDKVSKATEDFVFDLLVKREYKNHLRYYLAEEQFLYFLSRLVNRFPDRFKKFIPLLRKELAYKAGSSENPLNLAMHIIASRNVNIESMSNIVILLQLQSEYGYWEAKAFFKYGRSEKYFGCRELTTAFVLKAIEANEKTVVIKLYNNFFSKKPIPKPLDENNGLDVSDNEMANRKAGQGSNTPKVSLRSRL